MFNKIAQLVGPKFGHMGLMVKNYAPELYLAGGIVAGVVSVVVIAKAHAQAKDVFEDVVEELEEVKAELELEDEDESMLPTTTSEKARIFAPLYQEIAVRSLKLYGPGVLMGTSAVLLVLASHGVLRGRNRALIATATVLQQGFQEYRRRVATEYGEEAEERIFYGADSRKVTVLSVDDKGKTKKRKGNKNYIPEIPDPIMYSRVFDETNRLWRDDPEMVQYQLEAIQQMMNDQLYLRGYVMLNDVYEALGFSGSPEGAVVGWSTKMTNVDDYVSFGIDKDINGREGDGRRYLDFNVNGVVFELIGQK